MAGCRGAVLVEAADGSTLESVITDMGSLEALINSLEPKVCAFEYVLWLVVLLASGVFRPCWHPLHGPQHTPCTRMGLAG